MQTKIATNTPHHQTILGRNSLRIEFLRLVQAETMTKIFGNDNLNQFELYTTENGVTRLIDDGILASLSGSSIEITKLLIKKIAKDNEAINEVVHKQAFQWLAQHDEPLQPLLHYMAGWAIKHGNLEAFSYLVEKLNLDPHDSQELWLRKAALYDHLNIVKYLVEFHHTVINANNDAALDTAINGNSLNVVKYLLERASEESIRSLTWCADISSINPEIKAQLVAKLLQIEGRTHLTQTSPTSNTAVHDIKSRPKPARRL